MSFSEKFLKPTYRSVFCYVKRAVAYAVAPLVMFACGERYSFLTKRVIYPDGKRYALSGSIFIAGGYKRLSIKNQSCIIIS